MISRILLAALAAFFISTSASLAQPGAGYARTVVYASDHSVIADGATNNDTALQNAINACSTLPATGSGCILQLPCGQINVATFFNITHGVIVQGCGAGARVLPPPATADKGGTVIAQTCSTCDTFRVVTVDAVQFRDIGFDGVLDATAGTFIHVKPVASPATNPNMGSVFTRLRTRGGYRGIWCELCGNWSFSDSYFYEFAQEGILLTASSALADNGEGLISGVSLQGASTAAACLRLETQSAVKLVGDKFINCNVGVYLRSAQGVAGTLLISSSSFEQARTNDIRVERVGGAGVNYGNIQIIGNEFSSLSVPSFQGNIATISPGAQYIDRVIIASNIFVNGTASPLTSAKCVLLQGVLYGIVNGNLCNMTSTPGWGGIAVTTNSSEVSVLDNTVVGVGAGAPVYEFTVPTQLRDTSTGSFPTLSALPNTNVKDGSQAFVAGVTLGTAPCTLGPSNAVAFRQNSSWKC